MAHKLILNKGDEEQVHEFADIEEAFNSSRAWIMKGYTARITDGHGVVKYTQAAVNGQIATYPGDATTASTGAESAASGRTPVPRRPKPWWRFW